MENTIRHKISELSRTLATLFSFQNFSVMIITGSLIVLTRSVFDFSAPLLISENFGAVIIGFIYSVATAISAFGSIIGGTLSDIIGRKFMSTYTLLFGAVSFLLLSIAESALFSVVVAAVLMLIMSSLYGAAASTLIFESTNGFSEHAFSFIFLNAIIISSIGTYLSGYLIANFGYSLTYFLCAIIVIVACIGRLILLEETAIKPRHDSLTWKESYKKFFAQIRKSKNFIKLGSGAFLLLLISILITFASSLIWPYMSIYGVDIVGLSKEDMATIYSISLLFNVPTYLMCGFILKKVGTSTGLIVASISFAISSLFMSLQNPAWLLMGLSLMALVSPLNNVVFSVLSCQIVDTEVRSTYSGFMGTLASLVSILSPLLASAIWAKNPRLLFFIYATVMAPAIIASFAIRSRISQIEIPK